MTYSSETSLPNKYIQNKKHSKMIKLTFQPLNYFLRKSNVYICQTLSPSALCFHAHIWFSCPSFLSLVD